MSTLKFLWFDLGMTLVRRNREEIMKEYLKKFNIDASLSMLEKAYHLADKKYMKNRKEYEREGRMNFLKLYFKDFALISGVGIDSCELLKIFEDEALVKKSCWKCFEFTHDVLGKLRKNYSLGLISNWDNTARSVLRQNDIDRYFDHIVISEETGYEKPDREIFEFALGVSGAKSQESLYIGDNYYDDVVGSAKVGMKSLLINKYGNYGIEEIDHTVIFGIHELPELLSTFFCDERQLV